MTDSKTETIRKQAIALHRAGKVAEAAARYVALLEQSPKDAEILGFLGLAQFQLGREEEALAGWRASLAGSASAQVKLRTLAGALTALKARPSPAVAQFLSTVAIPAWPGDAPADLSDKHMIITLARGLVTAKRPDEAAALLNSTFPALLADRDFTKAAMAILIDAGHAARAAEILRPLTVDAAAPDGGLLIAHAAAAHLTGQDEEAARLIRRGVEAVPVHLTDKMPGQLLLVGVINQAPQKLERAASALHLHFALNTPGSLAFKHNDQYRFLSVFPEASSAARALAAMPKPDVFLNNWVNAERLSTPRMLDFIAGFADSLGLPVINHPRRAAQTTRQLNAERLAGIEGLVVPPVIRFANDLRRIDEGVRIIGERIGFPLIIRAPFAQKGIGAAKIDTPAELARHLAGQPQMQLYAIRYVHNPVAGGAYRKIRAAVIGDEVFITHVHFGPAWNVHRERDSEKIAAFDPDGAIRAEARRMTLMPEEALGRPAMMALHEIRRRIPLEFYGIDFDMLPDGRVLFFEANAAMNLSLSDRPGLERTRTAMREAVRRLFQSRAKP